MIPKLIIISLLTFKHVFTEETTTSENLLLHASTHASGITSLGTSTTDEKRYASTNFTNDLAVTGPSVSSFHLTPKSHDDDQLKGDYIFHSPDVVSTAVTQNTDNDLNHEPIVRYGMQLHKQPTNRKGYIEFEFDIPDGKTAKENSDGTSEDTNQPTSSSLKQMFSNIFPQGVADIFRFSYVAEPPNTKKNNTAQTSRNINHKEINLRKQVVATPSSVYPSPAPPLPPLPHPYPSASPLNVKKVITRSPSLMTDQDVRNINDAAELMNLTQQPDYETTDLNQNRSQSLIPFGVPINVDNRSDSDYEDHNLNLNEDNLIAPSEEISKQLFVTTRNAADGSYSDIPRFGPEKQINVQIIQDNMGGYGQKLPYSPTKQLDDFQEEVEKQFSPNDLQIESEAPSRKFLKQFKGNNASRQPVRAKAIQPESLLHTYIYSSESNKNALGGGFFGNSKSYEVLSTRSPYHNKVEDQPQSNSNSDSYSAYNESMGQSSNQKIKFNTQDSENQETKQISLPHTGFGFKLHPNYVTGVPLNAIGYKFSTSPDPVERFQPRTVVEVQKSVNIHNKFITEKNGNLIEQHEIYTNPKKFYDPFAPFEIYKETTPISLSKHPIRVAQAEDSNQSESVDEPQNILQEPQQQQHRQIDNQQPNDQQIPSVYYNQQPQVVEQQLSQKQLENIVHLIEKPIPYPVKVEKLVPQPYPVERLVEKYIDRPVHFEHIVEKQVNVPYPVTEVVEKIVDRPVPVEKIIDRPVHIPYPVQVDHFIDRPYAVQVPIAVAVPVPVHRYIDRPYPVEKIIEKPIPYPVEKVVEKIVEKHIPVEVERIVEKPVETIVEKNIDRPYVVKKFVNRPIPIHVPVPIGVPVAIALSKNKDSKKKPVNHKTEIDDYFELVPPPMPTAEGGQGYKTLPESIDYLILNDYNRPVPNENQFLNWGHPVKRGTKGHYVKRSPEFGRNLRVEYGFKPPLVPSLEINDLGLPLESWKSGN